MSFKDKGSKDRNRNFHAQVYIILQLITNFQKKEFENDLN